MAVSLSLTENWLQSSPPRIEGTSSHRNPQWRSRIALATHQTLSNRRSVLISSGASLFSILALNCELVRAKEERESKGNGEEEEDKGFLGTIQSLLDPNEKTKSGKAMPKSYLKSAREVVKTLRESLKVDAKDVAGFRRNADAAKESIREYLNGWKGKENVVNEESYVALERVIRSLANFYSKAGPFAALSEEVKSSILNDLDTAEASL